VTTDTFGASTSTVPMLGAPACVLVMVVVVVVVLVRLAIARAGLAMLPRHCTSEGSPT
jgi:hypothetical protein